MEKLHATEGKFFQSIRNGAPSKELRTQMQVLVYVHASCDFWHRY